MPDHDLPEIRRDHIIRANLPWRTDQLTECGRAVTDVATAITRAQAEWRIGKLGRERSAFTLCMVCMQTAGHAPQWETKPHEMLRREMRREAIVYYDYDRRTGTRSGPNVDRLGAELHAIAQLIANHPDEFTQLTAASTKAALFTERRRRGRHA